MRVDTFTMRCACSIASALLIQCAADADRLRADIQRDAACCRIGRNARDNGYGDAPVKCPKCDYLGFETGDRCKNCGYDFSLLSDRRLRPARLRYLSRRRR